VTDNPTAIDSGARALAIVLQVLGLPVDPVELAHQSGKRELNETDLLRMARRFPVKARAHRSSFDRLVKTPLPALAGLADGGWLVLGRVAEDKVLVLDPRSARPEMLGRGDFTERWNGRLILLSRRAALGDPARRFGIGWFVGGVRKYRAALAEVLVASFFLQLFGLMAPLFFQVVIDKVLVHRGLSTLEVLALGLGLLSVFDVVLGGLRTYLFAHTTNRIDVELGARLFRHLVALPMAYFQARRVGDTVARVRELETIRQFLTSSALSLVLDFFLRPCF
jgi:subfamily B ATP-binding cassette protein HlyB/CyaB